jgi:hypothetical protein
MGFHFCHRSSQKYKPLCDTTYRSDERLCDGNSPWFDRSAPDRPTEFEPGRLLSDNSYPRLRWTLFVQKEELEMKNIESGTKSFNIMTN